MSWVELRVKMLKKWEWWLKGRRAAKLPSAVWTFSISTTTQVEKEEDERSIATNKTARDSGEGETQYLSFDFVFRAQVKWNSKHGKRGNKRVSWVKHHSHRVEAIWAMCGTSVVLKRNKSAWHFSVYGLEKNRWVESFKSKTMVGTKNLNHLHTASKK